MVGQGDVLGGQKLRCRGRNVVERSFNKLNQWRGIAMRSDKTARSYRAAISLATTPIWINSDLINTARWIDLPPASFDSVRVNGYVRRDVVRSSIRGHPRFGMRARLRTDRCWRSWGYAVLGAPGSLVGGQSVRLL